jgi:prephenate dehydrogenase
VKTDIVFSNKTNIIPALQKTKIEINRVIELLQSQKANNLFNYFNQAKKERDKWFLKYFR